MKFAPKPWLRTATKTLGIVAVGLSAFAGILYIHGLGDRVEVLENRPTVVVKEVIITPEPTATPSATIAPIRRATFTPAPTQ